MQFKEEPFKVHLLTCIFILCGGFLYCLRLEDPGTPDGTVHFIQLVEDDRLLF